MSQNDVAGRTVLHVIERLSLGGAGQSLVALARALKAKGLQQRILSLLPAEPRMKERAEQIGISVVSPDKDMWSAECKTPDLVQLYYWNSPVLDDFLRSELPPMRCVAWLQVNCAHPPHGVSDHLRKRAERVIRSCSLPADGLDSSDEVIYTACDFSRFDSWARRPSSEFRVGYIGTVDPVKIHPNFVAMNASLRIPGISFLVFGSGGGFKRLKQEADALFVGEKFHFHGFVANPGDAFSEFDVLGYPLCEDNYSTSELVIQEALYLGIPPVVFAHGGAAELVQHNKTGFVVTSESEYRQAIEFLFHHPLERANMAEAGKHFSRQFLGAARTAEQFLKLYEEMLGQQKKVCPSENVQRDTPGAERFIENIGDRYPHFRASYLSHDRTAEEKIRTVTPVLAAAAGGGVLDYARYYPKDPHLRLWSGLILEQQGRVALALGEYYRAQKLGLSDERISDYITRATAAASLRA